MNSWTRLLAMVGTRDSYPISEAVAIFGARPSPRVHPFPLSRSSVALDGHGLRSGRPARVVVHARPGPFAFRVGEREITRGDLAVTDAERATVVRAGDVTLATVEHVLAACAALGLHEGVALEIVFGEVPLLDGASAAFVRALASLGVAPSRASLVVARAGEVTHGESRYRFEPGDEVRVAVTLAYDDPRIAEHAAWDGSPSDFTTRIARARTFAFVHEVEALVAAGQASHVDPSSVVVLAPGEVLASGEPFTADEPARHKLLDLMGDLFLHGGPPRGTVHAYRPGHRATHAIVREARCLGILAG
jgi:UDP-3-O-[3-hydroxymyristoyl] N-acetylglucosamine deacetylase